MSQRSDSNARYVRRVTLPSGRSIDVVYYEPSHAVEELADCPRCRRDLVYPIDWAEVSAGEWQVELHCPNCEWSRIGTFDQDTIERFDEQLDLGTNALINDLRHVARANMEAEADRFAAALAVDAILPEDF